MKTLLRLIGSYSWVWEKNFSTESPHTSKQLKMCFYWMKRNVCAASSYSHTVLVFRKTYRRLENATKCLTEAVIEHEHSKLSHQFLPTGGENCMCIKEGSSLLWGSLELCRVWQVTYKVSSGNILSLHSEQGMAASKVSLTLCLVWGAGPLGFAQHWLLSSHCLAKLVNNSFTFVLKAKLKEMYIIYELNSRLSFMKTMG